MKLSQSNKTSIIFHRFSTSHFAHKTPNPWTIEWSILILGWCIIVVRVHHHLSFTPIEQLSYHSLLIKLTFLKEYRMLIHHSSNCHIYCYKFKLLTFLILTMKSTHLHLVCNNFIFCDPMPSHPKLITHLIICLY